MSENQTVLYAIYAQEANIRRAFNANRWACVPSVQKELADAYQKRACVYLVFTYTDEDSFDAEPRILGMAKVKGGFTLPCYPWPQSNNQLKDAPCCAIEWLVKEVDESKWKVPTLVCVDGLEQSKQTLQALVGAILPQWEPEESDLLREAHSVLPANKRSKQLGLKEAFMRKRQKK